MNKFQVGDIVKPNDDWSDLNRTISNFTIVRVDKFSPGDVTFIDSNGNEATYIEKYFELAEEEAV